ncbi:MAG: hypothetical protein CVU39_24730, partial [Chloroflexi bacterium HGW-Chloroflexi-10]
CFEKEGTSGTQEKRTSSPDDLSLGEAILAKNRACGQARKVHLSFGGRAGRKSASLLLRLVEQGVNAV